MFTLEYKLELEGWQQMRMLLMIAIFFSLWPVPTDIVAQESDSQQRTRDIVAALNKTKHIVKEKYGIRRQKFKEIRSEAVLKENTEDYSGTYEVPDLGYMLNLHVGSDGRIEANGHEPGQAGGPRNREFELRNARIQGALLTATKIYHNGATEKFEGVFIRRTELNSPTDAGVSTFGLGAVGQRVQSGGVVRDTLFYQIKR
jgi:hypothetical protein